MESKKKNTIAKIIIIIAIILILLGILLAVFKNHDSKEKTYYATFVVDGVEYQSDIVIQNGYISRLPDPPKKDGYVFDYWEINGAEYTGSEKITANATLNAVFKEAKKDEIIVIIFNKDNGEENSTVEVIKNEKVTPISEPKKEGFEFVGWYLNGEEYSFDTFVQENITLTAKWKISTFIVKFDSKGGSKINSQEVEYSEKAESPKTPTRNGYKFLGWYLNNKKYDFDTKVTESITLIAKWEKAEEKIVYGDIDGDGKINSADALRVLYDINGKTKLTEKEKKNADVNADNEINYEDAILILANSTGYYKNTLPNHPIKNYILYGDLTEDGLLTQDDYNRLSSYISDDKSISEQAKKNADVNGNGKIDEIDLKNLKARLNNEEYVIDGVIRASATPITDYIVYGDVNEDGIIDTKDTLRLAKYLDLDEKITEQAKTNADVNADGKVNYIDCVLIAAHQSGWFDKVLPDSPITNYTLYGDLNGDGLLTNDDYNKLSSYISNNTNISEQAKKNADVNGNGKIDEIDLKNLKARLDKLAASDIKYNSGRIASLNPIVDYDNNQNNNDNNDTTSVIYGDVSEDGIVDNLDSVRLQGYIEGTETLGDQAKKNADVNADGKVNNVDLILLDRYLADWYDNTLPTSPIKDYVMYGDVNEDGLVDGKDSVRLQKHIDGTELLGNQGKKNADVNNDGSINDTDMQLLQKYLLDVEDGTIPDNPLS